MELAAARTDAESSRRRGGGVSSAIRRPESQGHVRWGALGAFWGFYCAHSGLRERGRPLHSSRGRARSANPPGGAEQSLRMGRKRVRRKRARPSGIPAVRRQPPRGRRPWASVQTARPADRSQARARPATRAAGVGPPGAVGASTYGRRSSPRWGPPATGSSGDIQHMCGAGSSLRATRASSAGRRWADCSRLGP